MNEKFKPRVIPNLTPRARDLHERLKMDRTFRSRLTTEGQSYSTEKEFAELAMMNKADMSRSYLRDREKVKELEAKVSKDQAEAKKLVEVQKLKDLEERVRRQVAEEKLKEGGKNG